MSHLHNKAKISFCFPKMQSRGGKNHSKLLYSKQKCRQLQHFPDGAKGERQLCHSQSSETHITLLPRMWFPSQGTSQLQLHAPHKQPSARLCRDINNMYWDGSAGLWAPVWLKKLLPLMIKHCSTLIMETLLKFDDSLPNKIWSVCDILSNKAHLPVFPSTQITKGRCAQFKLPPTLEFALLKFHLIVFIFKQGRTEMSL